MAFPFPAAQAATSSSLPNSEYSAGVLRFINAALDEGIALNKSQYNYDKIGATIDAIMGADEPVIRSARTSNARLNKIQKIALEMRAMLTDIKMFWEYTANAKRFEPQANIFQKLARNWYLSHGVDQVFRDTIDYVLAAGTGYVHMFWNPDLPGPPDTHGLPTMGDVDVTAEDPRDVFVISPSGDRRTLRGCRGVVIRRERPTRWLKQTYGHAADNVESERTSLEKQSPSQRRMADAQDAVMQDTGTFWNTILGGGQPAKKIGGITPITDEFTIYLHDFSTNASKSPKEMGEWFDEKDAEGNRTRTKAGSWCYIVPPGGRLYPFGREIVATRFGVLSDGPCKFHFGATMFPVFKVTLDTWAWSMLGTSPIQGLLSLQRSIDENVRVVQQHIRRLGKRAIAYDKNAVSSAVAKKLNMMREGQKIAVNPHASGPKGAFQVLDEPPLDPSVPQWLEFLIEQMDDLSGVGSLKNLTGLNQIPTTETIDKMIESMTPLIRARSRSMEVFARDFAMGLASMIMQFYTLDLRLRLLGGEGMTAEDWNYRPGDLMPDYLHDADYDEHGALTDAALSEGPSADYIRNAEFLRYFDYNIAPGSLLDAAKITKKLLYLQLSRMGLCDHWTLGEVLELPNQGKPPSWAMTIDKRLQAEKLMGLGVVASTVGRSPSAQTMPHLGPHGINES